MTAPVRIEAEAWSDLRFATLARLLNLADLDHALIKVARIWSWQAEHYTPEEPTYVVDAELIESALGPGGADALVRSRLAERVADGSAGGYPGGLPSGYRMKGTEGRIEWLYQRRSAALKGGQANKRRLANKPKPSGYPSGLAPGLAVGIAIPEPNPSPLPPALVPEELSLPRTIPGTAPGASVEPDPELQERIKLGNEGWDRLNAIRAEVASKHAWRDVRPLHHQDPGRMHLAMRLRESGAKAREDLEHVLAVARAEALDKGTVEYLGGAMFEPKSWAKKLAMRVEDVTRSRAGPRTNGTKPDEPVRKIKTL